MIDYRAITSIGATINYFSDKFMVVQTICLGPWEENGKLIMSGCVASRPVDPFGEFP